MANPYWPANRSTAWSAMSMELSFFEAPNISLNLRKFRILAGNIIESREEKSHQESHELLIMSQEMVVMTKKHLNSVYYKNSKNPKKLQNRKITKNIPFSPVLRFELIENHSSSREIAVGSLNRICFYLVMEIDRDVFNGIRKSLNNDLPIIALGSDQGKGEKGSTSLAIKNNNVVEITKYIPTSSGIAKEDLNELIKPCQRECTPFELWMVMNKNQKEKYYNEMTEIYNDFRDKIFVDPDTEKDPCILIQFNERILFWITVKKYPHFITKCNPIWWILQAPVIRMKISINTWKDQTQDVKRTVITDCKNIDQGPAFKHLRNFLRKRNIQRAENWRKLHRNEDEGIEKLEKLDLDHKDFQIRDNWIGNQSDADRYSSWWGQSDQEYLTAYNAKQAGYNPNKIDKDIKGFFFSKTSKAMKNDNAFQRELLEWEAQRGQVKKQLKPEVSQKNSNLLRKVQMKDFISKGLIPGNFDKISPSQKIPIPNQSGSQPSTNFLAQPTQPNRKSPSSRKSPKEPQHHETLSYAIADEIDYSEDTIERGSQEECQAKTELQSMIDDYAITANEFSEHEKLELMTASIVEKPFQLIGLSFADLNFLKHLMDFKQVNTETFENGMDTFAKILGIISVIETEEERKEKIQMLLAEFQDGWDQVAVEGKFKILTEEWKKRNAKKIEEAEEQRKKVKVTMDQIYIDLAEISTSSELENAAKFEKLEVIKTSNKEILENYLTDKELEESRQDIMTRIRHIESKKASSSKKQSRKRNNSAVECQDSELAPNPSPKNRRTSVRRSSRNSLSSTKNNL